MGWASRSVSAGLAGAALLALAGCDSSSPAPTPTPTSTPNVAPVFTSPAAATVAENRLAAYTATATDANGDALTFSISGGADAALFQISAAGALSFRTAPDFEVPRDAGADNVYSVELTVSDGRDTSRLTVAITVTDVTTGSYRIRHVAGGFTNPNNLTAIPGDPARVFVTERGGRVLLVNPATGAIAATPFLDVSAQVATDGARGLLGFAPAPDFATSRTIYVAMNSLAGEVEIRRYRTLSSTPDQADPASADVILRIPNANPDYAAGWIGFGPDGLLYITTSGAPAPGASINDLVGKVLRIDVSRDIYPADPDRDYGIPLGNPGGSGRDEILVRGFKAPQTASIDRVTGYMFVSDFGNSFGIEHHGDEINMIRPLLDGGLDYSPLNTRPLTCTDQANPPGLGFPIYCNEIGLALPPPNFFSVVTGVTYRGNVESLQGRLFVGQRARADVETLENILNIRQNEFAARRDETLPPVGAVVAFGEDSAGNVYFLQPNGDIYVLEPS